MKKTGTAYFVANARVGEELIRPHLLEQEKLYEIIRTVTLGKIDYENFITDMLVSRDYLEDPEGLCSQGHTWHCVFVRQKRRADGFLVIPDMDGFIQWAAYLSE